MMTSATVLESWFQKVKRSHRAQPCNLLNYANRRNLEHDITLTVYSIAHLSQHTGALLVLMDVCVLINTVLGSLNTCSVQLIKGSKYLVFHFFFDLSCFLGCFDKNEDHKGREEGNDAKDEDSKQDVTLLRLEEDNWTCAD